MLEMDAAVWILIEMAGLCLPLAVDSTVISFQLWGLFLVSVQPYHKNLRVTMSRARNQTEFY